MESIEMIPNIIHYTWFSGEAFPAEIQECVDSWKKHMPDYELKLWDAKAIESIDSVFLKEALKARKWAYAADFVRLYALVHYGGIYLDTDAMIYKSLDPFLEERAFIGKENSIHFFGGRCYQYLSSHCMGSEKNHPFMRMCLDYYDNRHFIVSTHEELPPSLKYNLVLLPFIQSEIATLFGYDSRPLNQGIQQCDEGLMIYPTNYFDMIKEDATAYCRHLALGSWRDDKVKEPQYNLNYKIQWRIWKIVDKLLKPFGRQILKLD